MESREALNSDVYRQEVWKQVNEVVAFVEQAVQARSAVHELERGLWERMLALGHGCLKLFFSLCGDGDQGAELCLPEGRVLQRLPERHVRPYQSVFGPFELARVVYGTREGQTIEAVPLDERLRLPANKFSYLVQEWTQPSIVQLPYAQAQALLAPILPHLPAVHSLERMHHVWASDVAPFWDAALPPPGALGLGARGLQRRRQGSADSGRRARAGRRAHAYERRSSTGAQEDRLGRQRLHRGAFRAHTRRGVQEPV
jgi:hypothetical protein